MVFDNAMKLFTRKTAIITFFAVFLFLGSLVLVDMTSPAGFLTSSRAVDIYDDCPYRHPFQQEYYFRDIDCVKRAAIHDFSFTTAYSEITDFYQVKVREAKFEGEWFEFANASLNIILYGFLYWITVFGPTPWILWSTIGAYLLLYDHVPDFWEKVIEGLVSGAGVSALILAQSYVFKHYMSVGQVSELNLVAAITLVAWLAIDLRYGKYGNILFKILILTIGLVVYTLTPSIESIRAASVPFVTIVFSISFYRWERLSNPQQQITALIALTVVIGLLSAFAKHWSYPQKVSTGTANIADTAELVLDFIIFILGAFLTLLEIRKGRNDISIVNNTLQLPEARGQPSFGSRRSLNYSPWLFGLLTLLVGYLIISRRKSQQK